MSDIHYLPRKLKIPPVMKEDDAYVVTLSIRKISPVDGVEVDDIGEGVANSFVYLCYRFREAMQEVFDLDEASAIDCENVVRFQFEYDDYYNN